MPPEAGSEQVEQLAQKLLRSNEEPPVDSIEQARRVARRRLEDSEARTFDKAPRDPRDRGVIRRSSDEGTEEPYRD